MTLFKLKCGRGLICEVCEIDGEGNEKMSKISLRNLQIYSVLTSSEVIVTEKKSQALLSDDMAFENNVYIHLCGHCVCALLSFEYFPHFQLYEAYRVRVKNHSISIKKIFIKLRS